jgi:hypothetical protein
MNNLKSLVLSTAIGLTGCTAQHIRPDLTSLEPEHAQCVAIYLETREKILILWKKEI